jgi:hypothetical protein
VTATLPELVGLWESEYSFHSTGRDLELTHRHCVGLRAEHGRLVGRSVPTETGAIELELSVAGLLVTGSWTAYTARSGYYRGAAYHGVLQLVLDPTNRFMTGMWLGADRSFAVNSGPWRLTRSFDLASSGDAAPVTDS